jgi:hypothetical protein
MRSEIVVQPEEDKPPRSWDFFLTVFLIFLLLVLTGIFVVSGFGMGVITLTCADSSEACNYDVISIGTLLAIAGTSVVALAGIVVSIVFIARRKVSFLVPLVACLVVVGLFLVGAWLVDLAVPGA